MVTCQGCDKRHVGCHSTCQEYIDWKSDREWKNEIARKKRQAEADIVDAIVRNCEKVRRKKNRW